MSLEFIYQKEVNLDNENNFTVNISEKNKVEKEKFTDGDKYLLLSLDLKIKADEITKLKDYNKIKALSDLINKTKKNSNIDLTIVLKLPNHISFANRILTLIKDMEKTTYKYINTDTYFPLN